MPAKRSRLSTGDAASTQKSQRGDSTPVAQKGSTAQAKVQRHTLRITSTPDVVPEVLGVTAMALSPSEDALAVARSNGSIVIYNVAVKEKSDTLFRVTEVSVTGGMKNLTIQSLAWCKSQPQFLFASTLGGQVVQYQVSPLQPVAVVHRSGGAIWGSVWGLDSLFTANADGSCRQYAFSAQSADGKRLQEHAIYPKHVDCNRALCVAVSEKLNSVAVGDDAGFLLVWDVLAPTAPKSLPKQKWLSSIPGGFAYSAVFSPATADGADVILVGTSTCQVVCFDATTGATRHVFSSHKGPVVALCAGNTGVFASGWHDSLRAFQCKDSGAWFPGEVRRITHYHEATCVVAGASTPLLFSASKDGTIMVSNQHTFTKAAPMYIDSRGGSHSSRYAASSEKRRVVTFRGCTVEGYELGKYSCVPEYKIELNGDFFVRGVWANADHSRILAATDERVVLYSTSKGFTKVDKLWEREVYGVSSACFIGETLFYACGAKLFQVDLAEGTEGVTLDFPSPITTIASHPRDKNAFFVATTATYHFVAVNANGNAMLPFSTEAMQGVVSATPIGDHGFAFFSIHDQRFHTAIIPKAAGTKVSRLDAKKPSQINCGALPNEARLLAQVGEQQYIAMHPNGLIYCNGGYWSSMKEGRVEFAASLGDEECLLIQRNTDKWLQTLPKMWAVRRFAN